MSVFVGRVMELVNALRTTTIPQTTGTLFRVVPSSAYNTGACCLGIGCYVVPGLEIKIANNGTLAFDGEDANLPDSAREWFGFDRKNPYLVTEDDVNLDRVEDHSGRDRDGDEWSESYHHLGITMTATSANDDYGLTFDQIADLFEWQYCSAPLPEGLAEWERELLDS